MTKSDNIKEIGMHVFERAGLGKAPFRFVGSFEKVFQACPDAPRQPGGTCDFCGTGIMICCAIRSADGREFKVGSDCLRKTGDAGLIKAFKSSPEQRKKAAAARQRKAEAVRAEWDRLWADPKVAKFFDRVVGTNWRGEPVNQGEELKRIWRMCGAAGEARWLRFMKAELNRGGNNETAPKPDA